MNNTTFPTMNYIKTIILFLFICNLTSCDVKQKPNKNITSDNDTQSAPALNIPDKVEVNKDKGQIQLPGTHLFVSQPEGFKLLPEMVRLQKSDDVYIHFVETFGVSYYERKPDVMKAFDDAKDLGLIPYLQKEFKLGDYDAFIIYGADNKPYLDQIVMMFGDNDFSVMIAGALIRNDNKSKQQIADALQTIYVDKSAKVDYESLSNFTIDLSKSDFKFNRNMSSIFYYTKGGAGDPLNDPFLDQIMVMPLPAVTYEKRVEFAEDVLPRYARSGMTPVSEVSRKEVEINGMKGYEITFDTNYMNKPMKVYILVTGDNKATISYTGMANNDIDKTFKQIEQISKTLKSK